jgi:hypothetical protein
VGSQGHVQMSAAVSRRYRTITRTLLILVGQPNLYGILDTHTHMLTAPARTLHQPSLRGRELDAQCEGTHRSSISAINAVVSPAPRLHEAICVSGVPVERELDSTLKGTAGDMRHLLPASVTVP